MHAAPSDETQRLLTAEEVADVLRVHPTTVRRWAERGEIEAKRLPNGWRFPASVLDMDPPEPAEVEQ